SAGVVLNKGLKVTFRRQSPVEAKPGQISVEVAFGQTNEIANEISREGISIADTIAAAQIQGPDRSSIEASYSDVAAGKEAGTRVRSKIGHHFTIVIGSGPNGHAGIDLESFIQAFKIPIPGYSQTGAILPSCVEVVVFKAGFLTASLPRSSYRVPAVPLKVRKNTS